MPKNNLTKPINILKTFQRYNNETDKRRKKMCVADDVSRIFIKSSEPGLHYETNMTIRFTLCFQYWTENSKNELKIYRSDLHLSSLGRVVVSLPFFPVDTVSIGRVLSVVIQAVQVGFVTRFVPPGSLETCGTIR